MRKKGGGGGSLLFYNFNFNFFIMKKQLTAKTYKLLRLSAPLSYILPSRNSSKRPLLYFDEDKGHNRPLRYSTNQKSPFEEEQDDNAVLEPIIFENGMLHVSRENQVLQEFLYYHPGNNKVFAVVDKERDAAEELKVAESQLEAQIVAKELDLEKLVSVSRVLMGSSADKLTTTELRRDMLLYAKNNPEDFLNVLSDPMLELQDKVHQFFTARLLSLRNKNKDVFFNLKENKKRLLTVPYGEEPMSIVASYLQSEEGVETYKLLDRHLSKMA